jgi:hypothetical protein
MYPQTLSSLPNDGGGYVPYFYQSGDSTWRTHCRRKPHRQVSRTSSSSTPESASLEALFQRADRTQTVEQVIARGYFAVPPSTDQAEAIITDKRHTSRLGLDDVIGQIRRRYTIYEQNTEQIERSKCAAINGIYQHEAYLGPGSAILEAALRQAQGDPGSLRTAKRGANHPLEGRLAPPLAAPRNRSAVPGRRSKSRDPRRREPGDLL